jgi:UDP-4-amino-4-deoxy-L-arabinose formyltransferase/UDP-glucuronic acid dehydrogenase (UDP-4-keto-hexauronic acid decarboxylating)
MLALSAQALSQRGHDIVLVVAPGAPRYATDREELRALADGLGCRFLAVPNLSDAETMAALAQSGAEVAISVNWPTIVPPAVLELFSHGVLNAHAGDLPRHRGNATIAWAILTGEPEVVLTIHRMDAGLDSGPVFAKRACAITENTYVGDVYAFCERTAPELFSEVVDGLARGALQPTPQPGAPASSLRCHPRTPEDGWIDWSQDAVALARLVRASAQPFGGAYTALGDERLTVWRARAEPLASEHLGVPGQVVELRDDSGAVAVLTAAGVLVLARVQSGQGPVVPATELLRSTRLRLGIHLPTRLHELERRVAALERRLSRDVEP